MDTDHRTDDDTDSATDTASAAPEHDLGWTGWLISAGIHAILLLVLVSIVFVRPNAFDPPPVTVAQTVPLKPPQTLEPERKRLPESPMVLDLKTDAPVPNPHTELVVTDDRTTTEDHVETDQAKGDPSALATSEAGSTAFIAAIGCGPGSGPFGPRGPGGRKHAIGPRGGATRKSEQAVERGLRWLKRHQALNGMWDAVGYADNCTDGAKCEPGAKQAGDDQVALTGYAVLCFLSAGYDHRNAPRYRDTVRRGLDYLLSVQRQDGRLGARNYENAVAAMAVIEAFGMTRDPELAEPAQRAVDSILACQAEDPKAIDKAYGRLGWDYGVANPARNDASVSGWNVMALKSAFASGLDVKHGIDGAKNWLERTWKAANPGWAALRDPYRDVSRFPYCFNGLTDTVDIAAQPGAASHDLACVGLVSAVFLGHHQGDLMLESLGNYVMKHQLPTSYAQLHTYYTYYNTLGIYHLGGERWKQWNAVVRDLLVDNQRQDESCFDGSWDWATTVRWHGLESGRVLATCYNLLSLEVYYRYALATKDEAGLKRMRQVR